MRGPVDEARIREFVRSLGLEAKKETRLYFNGGATAALFGWRTTNVTLNLEMVPESDSLLRAIPELKEKLRLNVELASPADFIPEIPGWEGRSRFIAREGNVSFYHYDFYSQALSKLQRAHAKDLEDVKRMRDEGLVERAKLLEFFEAMEKDLYRFPAMDPASFRRRVESAVGR